MKKIILLGLVAMLVLGIAGYVYAAASGKIGADGPHDMIGKATISPTATGEPCAFCHTPHNSSAAFVTDPEIPLRNRTTVGSNFCYSCHDGTTNVSAGIVNQPNAGALTGGLLSGYSELDPAEHVIGGSGHVVGTTPTWATGYLKAQATAEDTLTLTAGALNTIECAGCHYVHNHAVNTAPFLRIANTNSALCLACHDL